MKILEGKRNDYLFRVGLALRGYDFDVEIITNMLREANAACEPPLPDVEVAQIARSVMRASGLSLRSRSFESLCRILRDDELRARVLPEVIEFDEFAVCVTLNRKPVQDADVDAVREASERVFTFMTPTGVRGLQYTSIDVGRALHLVSRARPFHPVREYLRGITWDGKPRLFDLARWLRVGDDDLTLQIVRKWMISAVARALSPGAKVDTIMCLIGPQGSLKSSAFKALMPNDTWFSDSAIDIHSKDAYLGLRSIWLLEFAELESLARARDANAIKAFLSSTSDRYRPPYGREVVEVPRSCVIVATTNDDTFLNDSTGNRRYWTLRVKGVIDVESIRVMRDQLWAEAVAAYDAGEAWHLDNEPEAVLAKRRREFEVDDPWTEDVLEVARTLGRVTTSGVLACLGKKTEARTRADDMRVAAILRRNGFVSRKVQGGARYWVRSGNVGEPSGGRGAQVPDESDPSPASPTSPT